MITGKSRGLKKGDFVHTGLFPAIIISDVHTSTPCCEVWGIEHEMGSAYASDLVKLSFEDFISNAILHGHTLENLEPYSDVSKKAIKEVQGVTA